MLEIMVEETDASVSCNIHIQTDRVCKGRFTRAPCQIMTPFLQRQYLGPASGNAMAAVGVFRWYSRLIATDYQKYTSELDEGRNTGRYVSEYAVQHSRRQESSFCSA